jgi:Flp pilus assembly protein TadB
MGDRHLTLGAGVDLGIAIVALLGAATLFQYRVSRTEFARLQKDVKRLSEDVEYLVDAERQRSSKELQSSKKEDASKAVE